MFQPCEKGILNAINKNFKILDSSRYISVTDFPGVDPTGLVDSTDGLQLAIDSGQPLYIPKGTYLFSALNGLDRGDLRINGAGINHSILRFTGSGDAITIGTMSGYRQNIHLSDFTIEGNGNTDSILKLVRCARSSFKNINLREAKNVGGVGLNLIGTQLSFFNEIFCSNDFNVMDSIPEIGLVLNEAGFGNSSNNIFDSCYFEGSGPLSDSMSIGIQVLHGDQNTFISGSPESCRNYGAAITGSSRYNTFIGVGFENLGSTADWIDVGISTQFINCYSSQKAIMGGRSGTIRGGYFENITVENTAEKNSVESVTVNHWDTGSGGFFDSGINTKWRGIFDSDSGLFLYPNKSRVAIPITSSPQSYVNDTGEYQMVIMNGGNIQDANLTRNSQTADIPFTSNAAQWILAPGDSLGVVYSGSPSLFVRIPMSGLEM